MNSVLARLHFPLTLALTVLAGCYGAAPPRPVTIPLPPISEGAQITVHTAVTTTMENVAKEASTCPTGHGPGDPLCTVTRYVVSEPVTRTKSTATYAGEPISYAQLRVMTDANRDTKLATLERLSHGCKRANVPRYVGIGLMLSSVVLYAASGNKGVLGWTAWGALAGGIGSYALGYYSFGGRDCNTAERLYREVDVSEQVDWTEVMGSDYAAEMKTMAESFNASRSHAASAMRMR